MKMSDLRHHDRRRHRNRRPHTARHGRDEYLATPRRMINKLALAEFLQLASRQGTSPALETNAGLHALEAVAYSAA